MKLYTCLLLLILSISGCEKVLIGPGPGNSPADNFEVLWTTIDEKYGLFPVSDLNWDSLYTVYRGQINPSTTENQLWEISCNLLSHLKNGHVTLVNKQYNKAYTAESPDPTDVKGVSFENIKSLYLVNPAVTGEGFITYGQIRNTELGYIGISSFYFAENGRDWIKDLDNVIRDLSDCAGIVIDVRNNGGGYVRNDEYAAGLFVDHEVTYYYSKQKTGPGHDDFGEPAAKTVFPHKDLQFIKKNAVLTNSGTASGGEAFTIALKNLSYSVQIGDTTLGAIGEVTHVAQMPNGWVLYYPCTLSLYPDGTSPECTGVIPDIVINNTPSDVLAGKDKVLERAIQYLEINLKSGQ